MIQKRFIITGIIEVGEYLRIILYPDEPVKKKKIYNLIDMASSGDISEMNKDAIINSIVSGNPPTIYITHKEFLENDFRIGQHIVISLEVE